MWQQWLNRQTKDAGNSKKQKTITPKKPQIYKPKVTRYIRKILAGKAKDAKSTMETPLNKTLDELGKCQQEPGKSPIEKQLENSRRMV